MKTPILILAALFTAANFCRLEAAEFVVDSVVLNVIAESKTPADEAGVLVEICVQPGARVHRGDLLARIDDRDAALALEGARLALEHAEELAANDVKLRLAQKSLALAELEWKRAEEANRELSNVVSATQIEKLKIAVEKGQVEVEQAQKEVAAAQRGVKAANHDVQVAERAVDRRRVLAPIDGVVAEVRRQPGEWVQPGETILRLVRDDKLRAEGFVHVSRLASVRLGERVALVVVIAEGTEHFPGTVTFISPESNPINGQVRLWAEIDNREGRLRAGLPAQLLIRSPGVVSKDGP
jgi:macrolide-specific efflux system membrane fusion protein